MPKSRLRGVVLMLAADSSDRGGLRLREEYRHVRAELGPRTSATMLRLLVQTDLRELGELLGDHDDVRIVHVSGRLAGVGPRLLEAPGGSVSSSESWSFVASFAGHERIACVFLNARHSPAQAQAIGRHVEWVVAMGDEVEDGKAIAFAGHFYSALAEGQPVDGAFDTALTHAGLTDLDEAHSPRLYHHGRHQGQPQPRARAVPAADPTCASQSPVPIAQDTEVSSGQLAEFEWLIPMEEREIELLVDFIEEHTGISLSVDPGAFLQRRLGPRLEALGMSRFLEYIDHLMCGSQGSREMEELIEAITTHETYFFRETYQLDALAISILPELFRRPGHRRPLRIWSAACSTGEEAYTLAMLLIERTRFGGEDARIIGTDISPRVIGIAKAATYGENSFRAIPPHLRKKYFVEAEGRWRVRPYIRDMCSFRPVNLVHTDDFAELGRQDLILCRNVLIYLSADVRRRAVEAFYDCLSPGGYLFLGHSESLLNLKTRFDVVQVHKDLVYRKPL